MSVKITKFRKYSKSYSAVWGVLHSSGITEETRTRERSEARKAKSEFFRSSPEPVRRSR